MRTRELPSAKDLTAEERADLCNGMGPKAGKSPLSKLFCWALRQVLIFTGLALLFDEASDDHDLHYALGGDEQDLLYYNVVFLGKCRWIKRKAPWVLHGLINVLSYKAFQAVEAGGGLGPFVWRDRALTLDELRAERAGQ